MSSYFDSARFCRLWRAHWAESWRDYAWFAGVAVMIDLVFIAIFLSAQSSNSYRIFQIEGQITWYTFGLFASGIIFAGRHFKHLVSPGSALIALMRPASIFEKWLLTFFCVGVLFPLAYTLLYSILNFPVVQLAKSLYASALCKTCSDSPPPDFSFYVPLLTAAKQNNAAEAAQFLRLQIFALLALWSLQGLVLGGTVFFKRSPVLKTVLVLFLMAVFLLWLGAPPKMGVFWAGSDDQLVTHSEIEYGLSLALWLGLPLLLWLAVFFHLKEREVS